MAVLSVGLDIEISLPIARCGTETIVMAVLRRMLSRATSRKSGAVLAFGVRGVRRKIRMKVTARIGVPRIIQGKRRPKRVEVLSESFPIIGSAKASQSIPMLTA